MREHARGACGGGPERLTKRHQRRQLDDQLYARQFERIDRKCGRSGQLERVGGVDVVQPVQLFERKLRGWRTLRAYPNGRPGKRCLRGYGPDPQ